MLTEPGPTLSHYRLIEKIGEGGMGVVWKAEDNVLGRTVAIKVLPADVARDEKRRQMFFDEARLASSLSEAHIVQVHEFGREGDLDFIVMEYVEGKPLNKILHGRPLPPEKVAEIGHQVARALSKAHRKGLLHRDLKPSNILVTPDGDAKVVDFGLATLFTHHDSTVGTEGPTQTLTEGPAERQKGIVGTIPYMSPEQVRGEKLDARSDIFSLGTVLYEMTTGLRPFRGATNQDVAADILKSRPKAVHVVVPKVPLDLDKIITKSLSPRRGDRYQNSEDLAVDLKRLGKDLESGSSPSYEELGKPIKGKRQLKLFGATLIGAFLLVVGYSARHLLAPRATPPDGKIMLSVLPFDNLSGDPEQEYFSDGMTEEMIAQLGRLQPQKLGVIARTSVMLFKDTKKPIDQIGHELGVDYLLEGSVRRAADRVRITAQLIQVSDQTHLWAESYERNLRDVLALQGDVARAIAREIKIVLTPAEETRLAAARPVNPGAYEAFLRGRYHCTQWTPKEMNKAVEYLQQAIEIDRGYAPAHAELATCFVVLGFFDYLPPGEAYAKARTAAAKALEIDDRLPDAHVALGGLNWYFEWNLPEAEREYQRAIELNPSHSMAHVWSAYTLGEAGRWEEAIAAARRAQELDPLSLWANNAAGEVFCLKREYDWAIKEFRKNLDLDPNDAGAHYFLAWPYEQKGMHEEAIGLLEKAVTLSEGAPIYLAGLGNAYALAGKRSEALKILDQLLAQSTPIPPSPVDIALVYIGLGDKENAFEWLEKAYEEHSMRLVFLKEGPRFDSLRDDPRFQDLLRRMNFPE